MGQITAKSLTISLTERYNDPAFSRRIAPKLVKIIHKRGGNTLETFKKGEKLPFDKDFLPDCVLDALIEAINGEHAAQKRGYGNGTRH